MARYDGVINTIKQGAKRLINRDDKENKSQQSTLNEQIDSGAIQQSANISPVIETPTIQSAFGNILNPTSTQTLNEPTPQQLDLTEQLKGFKGLKNAFNIGQQDFSTKLRERDDSTYQNFIKGDSAKELFYDAGAITGVSKRFGGWIKNKAVPAVKQISTLTQADKEVEKQQSHYLLGWGGGAPLELSLISNQTVGGRLKNSIIGGGGQVSNDIFLSDLNKYANGELSFDDFYNKDKSLFELKSVNDNNLKSTNDAFIGLTLSDDDKKKLKDSGYKKGDYTPTPEEFDTFISMYIDNADKQNKIYQDYGLDNYSEEIDVGESTQSDLKKRYSDIVEAGISDSMNNKIDVENNSRVMLAIVNARDDQFNRIYVEFDPIFRAETQVLQKNASDYTDRDKEILEYARSARAVLDASARGLNNWAIQNINASTDGGITNYLESYEGGKSLEDILTEEARKVAKVDRGRLDNPSASVIDIAQMMNEEFNYKNIKNTGRVLGIDKLQHGLAPTGRWLSEVGQDLAGAWRFVTGRRKRNMFADQDFNVGQLLRTDWSNGKYTRRSYSSQLGEYVPEIVGNLGPDIVLTALTEGGTIPLILRNANKVVKLKKLTKLRKIEKEINLITDATKKARAITQAETELGKISDIAKITQRYNELPTKWKLGLELTDKFITRGIVDQTINAQFAGYDTEAYSNASDIMAVGGTILTEWLPLIRQFNLGKLARGLNSPNLGTRGAGIWDLADYMDSSPEARQYMIDILGKELSTTPSEDLRALVDGFGDIMDATKQVYDKIEDPNIKKLMGDWNKKTMYNFINQTYGANSEIGKAVRAIVTNNSTNPADIIKYLGGLAGKVSVGPYISTIKFKQQPNVNLYSAKGYNIALDSLEGGFSSRLANGFTQADIDRISKIDGFSDVLSNQGKYFTEVDGKMYLSDEGMTKFNIQRSNTSLETLGLELSKVEDTKTLFKERMKEITNKGKNITNDTIDKVAESGAYDDVVDMVKEIVC